MTTPQPIRTVTARFLGGPTALLGFVKNNSRVSHNEDDQSLTNKIAAAINHVETVAGVALFERSYQAAFACFPADRIELGPRPISAVSEVSYLDADDVKHSLTLDTDYRIQNDETGYAVVLPIDAWPSDPAVHTTRHDAVKVNYTAGFGRTIEDIPPQALEAIVLLAGHWYENRETVLVGTISKELEFSVNSLVDTMNLDNWVH